MYLGFPMNPRIIESRVGDGTNTKKAATTYVLDYDEDGGSTSHDGQVDEAKVYDSGLSTVLKTQKFSDVTTSAYLTRRMVSLPSEVKLYQGTSSSGTLMSKLTYTYDGGTLTPATNLTQHDNTNYGTGFTYRGNVTEVKRWDVTDSNNSSLAARRQVAYNIAGSPVTQIDPLGRTTSLSYSDSWNDNTSRTTYGYPTTITDPGGFSSTIQYRFDFGANVWAASPTPYGETNGVTNASGKTTERTYEDNTGADLEGDGG